MALPLPIPSVPQPGSDYAGMAPPGAGAAPRRSSLKYVDSSQSLNAPRRSAGGYGDGRGLCGCCRRGAAGRVSPADDRAAARSRRRAAAKKLPPFKKSWRSLAVLMAKFIGPLVALVGFYTAVYFSSMSTLDDTFVVSSIMVTSVTRTTCTREALVNAREMLLQNWDRAFTVHKYHQLLDVIECVTKHDRLLTYGPNPDDALGNEFERAAPVTENGMSPHLSGAENEAIYTAQFSDACPFVAHAPTSNVTEEDCRAWSDGVAKQGLQSVQGEYVRRILAIADRRLRARVDAAGLGFITPVSVYDYAQDDCPPTDEETGEGGCVTRTNDFEVADTWLHHLSPAPDWTRHGDFDLASPALNGSWASLAPPGAEPYSVLEELRSPDFTWLEQADALMLTPSYLAIDAVYERVGLAYITSFLTFLEVFVATFLAALVLFVAGVFLPQVRATNADITTKRAMLLFLPPQVVRQVRSIRELVDEILADDATGLGRNTQLSSRAMASLANFHKEREAMVSAAKGGGGGGGGQEGASNDGEEAEGGEAV
jgi:hypothetical protein